MANLLDIAVVHYSPLKDRRLFLRENLEMGWPCFWITENLASRHSINWESSPSAFGVPVRQIAIDFRTNIVSKKKSRRLAYFESSILYHLKSLPFAPNFFKNRTVLPENKRLKDNFLDLITMHFYAVEKGLESDCEWLLVLEDDAVPRESFTKAISGVLSIVSEIDHEGPIWMNLNSGCRLVRTRSDSRPSEFGLFEVYPPNTRCATAYLINKRYMIQLFELIKSYGVPDWLGIDMIYQVVNRKINAKSFWSEPVFFLQGSTEGIYRTNFRIRFDGLPADF